MSPVWYPSYPVVSFHLGLYGVFGPSRQGYRARYIQIGIDASILNQPGWEIGLKRFWIRLGRFVDPFYGDIRSLHNYILKRGQLFIDRKTEQHPVQNGWWNGIPRELGKAMVIGDPYVEHWPKFSGRAARDGDLFYVSTDDWGLEKNIKKLVGNVPRRLAQGANRESLDGGIEKSIASRGKSSEG